MLPKNAVHQAMMATQPPLHGPMKVQQGVTNAVSGAIGALRPLLKGLQIGGSVVGAVSGAMNINRIVKTQGAKALLFTQEGRGALFNFTSSASYLGMMALPTLAFGPAGMAAGYAGLNIISNVFGGLSMLNYAGFFGDGGWLDHDSVRAAFLIPPLTPIGLAGLWMKRRKKQEEAKVAQLKTNQQIAVQQVGQLREQAAQQLQAGGTLAGAIRKEDGSLVLPTAIPTDLSKMPTGAAQGSAPPG
jgi:hypothetical protein